MLFSFCLGALGARASRPHLSWDRGRLARIRI